MKIYVGDLFIIYFANYVFILLFKSQRLYASHGSVCCKINCVYFVSCIKVCYVAASETAVCNVFCTFMGYFSFFVVIITADMFYLSHCEKRLESIIMT